MSPLIGALTETFLETAHSTGSTHGSVTCSVFEALFLPVLSELVTSITASNAYTIASRTSISAASPNNIYQLESSQQSAHVEIRKIVLPVIEAYGLSILW